MIKRVQVLHFRALKYVDVKLSNFQILVGPNASGKSTFLDILSLIRDVLDEGPQSAVEKRTSVFKDLLWKRLGNTFEIAIELEIPQEIAKRPKTREFSRARYEVCIQYDERKGITIGREYLWLTKEARDSTWNFDVAQLTRTCQRELFPVDIAEPEHIIFYGKRTRPGWRKVISKTDKGNDYFKSETTKWNILYKFGSLKASLARIPEDEERFPVSLWAKNVLMEGIQFLQLNSSAMRWPCRPDLPTGFKTDGSNLPKVIQYLHKIYPKNFQRWVRHVQTALPEVENIKIKERPEDRFLYITICHKNGMELPSWVISDGTLRLLAQTLIAYLAEKNRIYMIEEPENGLHPLAIESIFQSLSSVYDAQIMLATHSPALLRLAEPKDILCFSKTESGAVDIVRGENHPKLRDWKKEVDLATLHAAGVLQ